MQTRFSHLEVTHQREYDWSNNLMKKSLPERAFANPLTGNLILVVESMFVKVIKEISQIKRYFAL